MLNHILLMSLTLIVSQAEIPPQPPEVTQESSMRKFDGDENGLTKPRGRKLSVCTFSSYFNGLSNGSTTLA